MSNRGFWIMILLMKFVGSDSEFQSRGPQGLTHWEHRIGTSIDSAYVMAVLRAAVGPL